MGSEKDTYKIEKFNGTNFSFCKMQMEDYLYQKGLYLSIVEKLKDMSDEEWVVERKLGGMTNAEWMVLDRKTLGAIRLSLSKSIAFNIKGQETTTNLMKALSNLYEQPYAARKVHLIKKLVNLKMSENQSFKEHLNVFNKVTDGLNSVSIVFDDEVLAGIILGQMPESWSTTCQSIAKEKLTFQQVVDMIMT
jgi:acyl-activating enzyme 14